LGRRKGLQTPDNRVLLRVSAVAKKDFESHLEIIVRLGIVQGTKIILTNRATIDSGG
jgi:hypothetical protein